MLEVGSIDAHYGKKQVLDKMSLSVSEGEIVALVGPNAAGKSTTLRSIVGLKQPSSGYITFQGQQVHALSVQRHVKSGLILVPEGRQVFIRFTVLENLQMGAYLREDRNMIDNDMADIFELFPRLAERKSQKAGSMSGGEQQMLAIGRGLMAKPRLLLMDEPSLGLAPIVLEEIASAIRKLAKKGLSILLAEQNASFALRMADRGYVIESGSIQLAGSAAELSNDSSFGKKYLGN